MKLIMNKIIKENIKILEQFEDRFQTAVRSQYARAITSNEYKTLKDILVRLGGTVSNNSNCSKCQYNLLLELGKLYFAYKDEQASKTKQDSNTTKRGTIEESNKTTNKGERADKR